MQDKEEKSNSSNNLKYQIEFQIESEAFTFYFKTNWLQTL